MLNPTFNAAEMNEVAYGKEWSGRWEEYFGIRPETAAAVEFLDEVAEKRPVLEFGIGTGRIALPLHERGLDVHGVDNSPWMVEELRAQPSGDELAVTVGDVVDVELADGFGLIFMASGAILALTTQELQIKCFENAAAHLEPGGVFVVEVMSPIGMKVEPGRCRAAKIDTGAVVLSAVCADTVTQELQHAFIFLSDGEQPRVRATASRYCWPAELDLMARIAGLRLRERWGGWDRRPFTAESINHVSVYEQR